MKHNHAKEDYYSDFMTNDEVIKKVVELLHDNELSAVLFVHDIKSKTTYRHVCSSINKEMLADCIGMCLAQIHDKMKKEDAAKLN